MKKTLSLIILLVFLSACTPAPTPTPTPSLTPVLTATITPTLTPDPYADPDEDTYPTRFEQIWGTDPFEFTTFEELSNHPGTIYAKMRVSQPFEVDDMNGTLYQVVRVVEIEDKGTPDDTSDDHLIFEVVLFPYARYEISDISTIVDQFPLPADNYPSKIRQFLESTEISNITDEMRETLLDVVKDAETDIEAINNILQWNHQNIIDGALPEVTYDELVMIKAGDIFKLQKARFSTTWATLLAAELRSVGIPSQIIFGVSTNDDSTDCFCAHPQILVYLSKMWVRLDYNKGLNYRKDLFNKHSYGFLVFTDRYSDNTEADWSFWFYVDDLGWKGIHDRYLDLHEVLEFENCAE